MLSTIPRRFRATAFLLAAALSAQACSNDTTTTNTGSISIALTPTSATVQQGASTVTTGTLTRTDFTNAVAFTLEGVPTGVTGSVAVTGNVATVTMVVSSSAVVGASTITVRAKGTGLTTDATATFVLTVAAASAASYTMTQGTPVMSVLQGATGSSTLTFARTNFTGNVALTVDNLPVGVTASFVPTPVSALTSALTLTVGANAAPGLTTLIVRGTAAGLTDVTSTIALTVTAAPGFSLLATPASRTQQQGTVNSVGGVKATRTGAFAGTIAYSLTGAPTGVTAVFAATAVTDSTSVSITTTAGAVAGTYATVIHGISGAIDQTTPLSIVVTAAPLGSAVRLDYSACASVSKPAWVAFQDGTGAWTRVTGVNDVYAFNIASTKGALAVVTPVGAVFATTVQYFSQAEFAANVGGCTAAVVTKVVNGTIAGLGSNDVAAMSLGGSTANVQPNASYVLPTVASGLMDLVGYRRNTITPGTLDRGLLRRDQNIATGGSLALVDFNNVTESFDPFVVNSFASGGGAGDLLVQSMAYLTGATCSRAPLYSTTSAALIFPVYGVPLAQQRAGDFHNLTLTDPLGASGTRTVSLSFHTQAPQTLTFGAAVAAAVTNVTGTAGYKRLQAALTLPTDYPTAQLLYADAPGNSITVRQGVGYLAGSSAVTLSAPDFTGTAGLLTSWFPATGAAVTFAVSGATIPPASSCTEGAVSRTATFNGTN